MKSRTKWIYYAYGFRLYNTKCKSSSERLWFSYARKFWLSNAISNNWIKSKGKAFHKLL